jgi:ribonuclease P/MRP protein subunit RPP40
MAGAYGGRISLDPPVARLVVDSSSLAHKKSSHHRDIASHALNHAVEVTLPGGGGGAATASAGAGAGAAALFPAALLAATPGEASDVYYTVEMTLVELLRPEIRGLFKAGGALCGVTVGSRVDGECVAAVLPSGILHLALDRSTYHLLGLQGKPSVTDPKQRFVVTVDLADDTLTAKSKRYERLHWCFTDRLGLRLRFQFVWVPPGGTGGAACPPLAAIDTATEHRLDSTGRVYRAVPVPTLDAAVSTAALLDDEAFELSEWLGAVSGHLDVDGSAEGYHSTFTCPEPSSVAPSLLTHRWRGMVSSARVAALLAAAETAVTAGAAPWVAITVWGFQDTPVSWGTREHGHMEGGENHYTYVVGPAGRYLRFTFLDPADACT